MRRRDFVKVIAGSAVVWPRAARAQQQTLPAIAFLDSRSPEAVVSRLRPFRQGLQQNGYVEGENVAIIYGFAENQLERLSDLARDLTQRQVAVIVTAGEPGALAAKAATTTIPIVFGIADDPAKLGLVASLARPGGNITGINFLNAELTAKRLELLRQLLPRADRIAVLVNPAEAGRTENTIAAAEAAARTMGLQIQVFKADTSRQIETAFEDMERDRPDALFIGASPFLNVRNVQLAMLAAFHRLPGTHSEREYAEAGGLISYGTNIADAYRQMGVYAGRILKGTKVAELPVVQSSKLELVINAATGRMLGITVPASLLSIADDVIE
jgi:putative tryptophan/tyrosine transport system substrate-binding protein